MYLNQLNKRKRVKKEMDYALSLVTNKFNFSTKASREAIYRWGICVKTRDNNICKDCGSVKKLIAHHIYSKILYPAKAFYISNGITLCFECHKNRHRNPSTGRVEWASDQTKW